MRIRINVNFKVNRVVRSFIFVDLALLAGWGLIEPILSVYVVNNIPGATIITVGTGAAIYWLLKSLLQLPIANYLDKNPGEEDDFRVLIGGLFLAALSAFLFAFVETPSHFYLVQAVHALAFAFYLPAWSAIFSRHLDKERVSFDWSLDSTAAGLSAGASGFLGGVIANWWGFPAVFSLAAFFSLVSAFVLILTPELVLPKKNPIGSALRERTPAEMGK